MISALIGTYNKFAEFPLMHIIFFMTSHLFNILPSKIRKMINCFIDDFNFAQDEFPYKIPDESRVSDTNYTPKA